MLSRGVLCPVRPLAPAVPSVRCRPGSPSSLCIRLQRIVERHWLGYEVQDHGGVGDAPMVPQTWAMKPPPP